MLPPTPIGWGNKASMVVIDVKITFQKKIKNVKKRKNVTKIKNVCKR